MIYLSVTNDAGSSFCLEI